MSIFLDEYQYIINKVKHPATKATLEKSYAILVGLNAIDNLDAMLREHTAKQLPSTNWEEKIDAETAIWNKRLEDAGWVYCPRTTPPNFNGLYGWMHPFYSQRGHHHIMYVAYTIEDVFYYDCTLYNLKDSKLKYFEHKNLEDVMAWMDDTLEVQHGK